MNPGRFLSVAFLALGIAMLFHAGLEATVEESWSWAVTLAGMGLLWCGIAVHRIRAGGREDRPDEYGAWTLGVGLMIAGYVTYLAISITSL